MSPDRQREREGSRKTAKLAETEPGALLKHDVVFLQHTGPVYSILFMLYDSSLESEGNLSPVVSFFSQINLEAFPLIPQEESS